jgi:hypothetical protein
MIQAAIVRFSANAAGVRRRPRLSISPITDGTILHGRRRSGKTGAANTNTFCIDVTSELKLQGR